MGQDESLRPGQQEIVHLDFAVVADYALVDQSGTVNFAEPPAGVTEIEAAAVLVFDVPFPHAGQYRFEITVDGERKATVPITVSQMPPMPAPTSPSSPPSSPQAPGS